MPLSLEQLTQLGSQTVAAAVVRLVQQGYAIPATVTQLAALALNKAESDVEMADHWLTIAEAVATQCDVGAGESAAIAYAWARVHVHRGELTSAEAVLRQAQALWQGVGDQTGYSRSLLGLTQILAMQGRYDEAEGAARTAVDHATTNIQIATETDQAFAALMQQVAAHHNLATLLLYQERHVAALAEYEQIHHLLTTATGATQTDEQVELDQKLAHSHLNRATALTFLDQPQAAEEALQQAIALFAQHGDNMNLGRSRTNLGRLYLRTGQYGAALAIFEAAFHDLLGPETTIAAAEVAQLQVADELLLEYATACLAINLLPEAGLALARGEMLFRSASQPYELGQVRYTQALLYLRTQQWKLAQNALDEATALFSALQNTFWLNRTRLAQAAVAYAHQQVPQANQLLDLLLAETSLPAASTAGAAQWDIGGQVEARLLRMRIQLETGALAAAQQQATRVEQLLQGPAETNGITLWPHLQLRYHHMLGKLAQAAGDYPRARHHFKTALEQLEGTRATLLVEEVRSAFVNDKSELYADLVQTLFAMAPDDEQSTERLVAEAFAVIEQSRSRVLLERLLAALRDPAATMTSTSPTASAAEPTAELPSSTAPAERQRLINLREQLHWLYNQLMSESGSRRLDLQITRQLQLTETALQKLEWRHTPLLIQAQAVDLPTFQATLAPDQQAIVYAAIHEEIIAFLVEPTTVKVYRHLTEMHTLHAAIAELRFQVGRVEVDPGYVARHSQRLAMRLQAALHELYQLLLAPMAEALHTQRLLFVPFGPLHHLPLHALWDGARYVVEWAECSYAPSASLAVFRHEPQESRPLQSWAGFAIADPAIPAARTEVERVAHHFTDAVLHVEAGANRANLWHAAATVDILHLATHGLFRPDNPFFSALKLADGWVDVRELYRLPLTARLVVLSACESGVGEISGGDEVVGLARGILGAGRDPVGRELIATLWNVHDVTAAQLMDQFYRYLRHESMNIRPAAALRAAQCQAIQMQQHPYYWAAFFVIGA
ncbi:MAG: CHAT domain-containing tetratricopeptide repeat protein [Caldilineaceae bacterium]